VPHSISAAKRVRQNATHRARNRARKETLKDQLKALGSALLGGDLTKARAELNKTVQRLDKIAAKGTIHKNNASRRRSRLTKRLNALAATKK
jgi:small subunit ribosomal protein S20